MNTEKLIRGGIRFLIATGGAVVAVTAEPQTSWEWARVIVGALTAGFTAFEAFLSRYSGQKP